MSYAKVLAVGLIGLAGHLVEVEADLASGLPGLTLTGLPDTALYEARDRIRAALVNSGESWPNRRMTVNLLPAHLPKHGSMFDVAMAISLLGGSGVLPLAPLAGVALLGELGLDGSVRPIRGVLPAVLGAYRAGVRRVIVPAANAREAALVPGMTVQATDSLRRLTDYVRGRVRLLDPPDEPPVPPAPGPDLADVAGQQVGRRALEVAAAGAHHLSMVGPPGAGKTMLAQRLPSILPLLDDVAAMEVTATYSVAGLLPPGAALIRQPPFQAPHHSASVAALVGGGSGIARPGALSLAHRGTLFLDEAPEFPVRTLQALRQPLESGEIRLSRVRGEAVYPARFQLILAANPCPCAKPAGPATCECSPLVRRRYLGRLAGPLLDRIDLHVDLDPLTAAHLLAEGGAEPSAVVARRVAAARTAASARWSALGWHTNAEVPGFVLRRPPYRLPPATVRPLVRLLDAGALSARGHDRVLRVAWSIADLDGRPSPGPEAIALRTRLTA